MIDTAYVNVKKVDGVLKVIGVKVHFKDNGGFLFRQEDQDLAKHPLIAAELKSKQVNLYRNVKITGTALQTYFDHKTEKFIFNGVELNKDQEDSLHFTKEEQELFGMVTPRHSFGTPTIHSTPSPPKIVKVSSSSYDHLDVWKAIDASTSISLTKFDELKDDAQIWIGRLECAIIEVNGNLDIHGTGVLSMFLGKEPSKWLLTFQVGNEEKNWKNCKDAFIKNFEGTFAKSLYNCFERKKTEEKMEDYVKNRIETWSKLFPSLSKPELNLIVIAGISEEAVKKLKLHKHSDIETLTALCEAVVSSSTTSSASLDK